MKTTSARVYATAAPAAAPPGANGASSAAAASSPAAESPLQGRGSEDSPRPRGRHLPTTNGPGTLLQAALHAPGAVARGAASSLSGALKAAPGALAGAAAKLWSLSDLRTMLQPHGDDPDFLRNLRASDPEASSAFALERCRAQLSQLREVIQDDDGITPRFKHLLLKDVAAIECAIEPLQHGTSAAGRAAKALLNLVNLWPTIVPSPLLANQAKTFAYTVAAATKAVVGVAGASLRPTADGMPFPLGGGELGRHSDEVHFYPALLNAIFLSIEMSKKFGSETVRQNAQAVEHNRLAHAGFAVTAGLVLIAPFVWNSVANGANRAVEFGARVGARAMESAGFAPQARALRRDFTPGEVGQEVRLRLTELWRELEAGRAELQQARHDFTSPDGGYELTRTLNSQCTHLLDTIGRCTKRLDAAFGLDPARNPDASATVPRPPTGDDFSSKLALTIFAAAVTGSTVYLIQPDPIGTVDLSADAVVVTAVMAQSAWNRQATRQDAMERFKGMAATSMVMAIALAADKLSKFATPRGLVEANASAPYYASLVMTAMAMTMPGPVARGAELAMNWAGGQVAGLFRGPDGTQLATTVPASPQALQQRVSELHEYVSSLDQQQQLQYEQLAGQSILRLIDRTTSQPPASSPTPGSSARIEEIEVIDESAHVGQATTAAAPRSA
jgi:hypothetical protein